LSNVFIYVSFISVFTGQYFLMDSQIKLRVAGIATTVMSGPFGQCCLTRFSHVMPQVK